MSASVRELGEQRRAPRWRRALVVLLALSLLASMPTFTLTVAQVEYLVPITVSNSVGQALTDYTVKVVLSADNFGGWDLVAPDGSDIYFTDLRGRPLYYWVESFDKTAKTATIWVKVPNIPANGNATIYMWFGGENPYASYNDPAKAFLAYLGPPYAPGNPPPGWTLSTSGTVSYSSTGTYWDLKVNPGKGSFTGGWYITYSYGIAFNLTGVVGILEYYILQVVDWSTGTDHEYIGSTAPELSTGPGAGSNWVWGYWDGTKWVYLAESALDDKAWHTIMEIHTTAGRKAYEDGVFKASMSGITSFSPRFSITAWGGSWVFVNLKYYYARWYVEPEPTVTLGAVFFTPSLPSNAVLLNHSITFSPNSTQLTHSFTATYTGTAGYETGYGGDAWAWRVYANPYNATANTATLVSNATITLPYTNTLVEKLELYAKTNATGSYRRLWIKLLDKAGNVVVEVTNATVGTTWTLVTLGVNKSLPSVTIWINSTVTSTASAGEEICISGVKLYASYSTTTTSVVRLERRDYHSVKTVFGVNLTTTYLNSSTVDLLLIDKLIYNATDYPATPTYIGNSTINGLNYYVYRITNASSAGTYYVYSHIENAIKKIYVKSRGVEVTRVLVGEPFTVEIPITGNISVVEAGLEYINTSTVSLVFTKPGTYTIRANVTRPAEYILGYWDTTIVVGYGLITLSFVDTDGRGIDYEDLVVRAFNRNTEVATETTCRVSVSLTGLTYGIHDISVKVKGVTACTGVTVDLYSATNATSVVLNCTLRRLPADYRGVGRAIISDYDKRIVLSEDISYKYPYSRSRIVLNGTGAFTLLVDYYTYRPTAVSISSNVSITGWYWLDNALVITGTLGSLGEINITDLYKLRVELYDRLGNLLPLTPAVLVNGSAYAGPVVEVYLFPEDYVVELPSAINGFAFYGFFDGFGEPVRAVVVSHSDVTLRAWYRVPTGVPEVEVELLGGTVLSQLIRALQGQPELVEIRVRGRLLDYYGSGVPNRPVLVNITNLETGFTLQLAAVTDPSGYFATEPVEVRRGVAYEVRVAYAGDDVYVESVATETVRVEALPAPEVGAGLPAAWLLLAAACAAALVAAMAVRAAARALGAVEGAELWLE